ncbi:hypothetical protein SC206_19820 [Rouxiella sp. T17]|uniref:hypothetical protein n=1 Tax=Rouxiella sp. T17 TaxID=3085684 RepID=UPI002FCA338E
MDSLRCQSNYNSLKNNLPTVDNIALKDRVSKLTGNSTEQNYDKIYKSLVDFVFKQAQQELQEKIDDEKEPITW